MTIKLADFTFKRARKFYFALLAFASGVASGPVDDSVASWILAIVSALSASGAWLFPNDPVFDPKDPTKGAHEA